DGRGGQRSLERARSSAPCDGDDAAIVGGDQVAACVFHANYRLLREDSTCARRGRGLSLNRQLDGCATTDGNGGTGVGRFGAIGQIAGGQGRAADRVERDAEGLCSRHQRGIGGQSGGPRRGGDADHVGNGIDQVPVGVHSIDRHVE